MSEWKEYQLGDVVTFQRGHDLPKYDMKHGKYPVAGSNGIIGFHNEFTTIAPGITIGRSGSIGNPILHKTNFWAHNTTLYVKEFKKADPVFFYYLLKTLDFSKLNSGSAVPSLNRNFIHPYLVTIPDDIPTQTAIASILSSLDDKIELNNKINKNLEDLAQALFKQWFVDFEFPNEKGEPYKSSGGEMVESELGEIPKGWSIKTIEELSTKVGMGPFGANIKVETFVESGMPIISGQHLKNTLVEDNTFNFITVEHAERLKNSIVIAGDVIFTHAGTIGQVSYLPKTAKYKRYILSQRQFFLRPNDKLISGLYITLYFKTQEGQYRLLANTSSTGVPSISRPVTYLRSIKLVTPDFKVIQKFNNTVEELYTLLANNLNENKELSSLRDTILPKLISGELEVNEALQQTEKTM